MSDELRECPFCGNTVVRECVTSEQQCSRCGAKALVGNWNTRPIEDALRADCDLLTAELASETKWAEEYHIEVGVLAKQVEVLTAERDRMREAVERMLPFFILMAREEPASELLNSIMDQARAALEGKQ
jgi:hypothetical protein